MLVKNAEALERLETVDTLVVDKTGTLTEGKPTWSTVVDSRALVGRRRAAAGRRAGAGSEHPLAAAIVAARDEQDIDAAGRSSDFESVTGMG